MMSLQDKLQNKPVKFSITVLMITVGVVWFGSFVQSERHATTYESTPETTLAQERMAEQKAATTTSANTSVDAEKERGTEPERGQVLDSQTETESQTTHTKPAQLQTIDPDAPFANLNLNAKSAMVWHSGKRRPVFEYNSHAQLPPASLTKVMTAVVATEYLDASDVITLTKEDLGAYGSYGLRVGEKWRFDDLRAFMLMVSSNDAARAIGRVAEARYNESDSKSEKEDSVFEPEVTSFTSLMNDKAKEVGLSKTYFLNPSGLDLNESYLAGSYSSARDMAKLMAYTTSHYPSILKPTTRSFATFTSVSGTSHPATNTNEYTEELKGLLGSKTGYTVLAGGNLLVSVDAGASAPVVIVVLGSTREGRFTDVMTLYKATKVFYGSGNQETATPGIQTR